MDRTEQDSETQDCLDLMRKATVFHGVPPINEEECIELIQLGRAKETHFLSLKGKSVILGVLAPLIYNPDVIYAKEIFWYSERGCPHGIRVFEEFEAWAKKRGVGGIFMSMTDKTPGRISTFYEKRGYVLRGADFVKEIF